MYIAVWVLLTIRSAVRRRWITVSAVACAIIAGACGTSVAAERWFDRNAPEAVVTAMDVVVYKGPGTGYQRQFEQPLQPGVECSVRERRGNWWNIELADGNSGWIEANAAERIADDEKGRAHLTLD